MKSSVCFRITLLALLASLSIGAQPYPNPPVARDDHWCATGLATQERVASLDSWVRARDQLLLKTGRLVPQPAQSRIENDIILLDTSSTTLPFHHPFDLEGHSITFAPIEDDRFDVSTTALDYDPDIGTSLGTFEYDDGSAWHYRTVDLSSFTFPMGDAEHSRLYVTAHNSIQFAEPSLQFVDQLSLLDSLSLDGAVVSPLFHPYQGATFPLPEVFVKQGADAVTVTWRSEPSEWGFALDVQARLESSGRIIFSYRTIDEFEWGAVIVTSGAESWREDRQRIYSQGTPASGLTGNVAQMLDLRSIAVDRVGGSNMLEITLTVTARLRPEALLEDRYLGYWVELENPSGDGDWIMLYVKEDEMYYRTPDAGWIESSPSGEYEGNTVRMRVFQDTLNLSGPTVNVSIATLTEEGQPPVDSMSGTFSIGGWSREFGSDLSALDSGASVDSPVLEPFTLGAMNESAVWAQLKSLYGFTDEIIDGVAIFQDFYTDLILYAGAYSTVGNPQANGVSDYPGYGLQYPRSPALLHMNRVGYRWNADLPRSYHVLSHELGHRWLYFIDIDRGSGSSDALHPLGGHPAQYVHTPAAFKVYTDRDSSTMGGSNFLDHGNGTFSTPEEWGYYGYSWHDLYLMGLAAPEEVEDWYYIENTDPALGGAYYPPPEVTVSGTRQDVDIDDVIRAMGLRAPTVATSQKRFKVVFVLLSLPGAQPSPEVIDELNTQREWFERMFKVATGHRAEVHTTLVPVRRRGVRLP